MCPCVFGPAAGGMPVKMPQESSRISREANEERHCDVETGWSSDGDCEGQSGLSRQDSCTCTAVSVTQLIPDMFPDLSFEWSNGLEK